MSDVSSVDIAAENDQKLQEPNEMRSFQVPTTQSQRITQKFMLITNCLAYSSGLLLMWDALL